MNDRNLWQDRGSKEFVLLVYLDDADNDKEMLMAYQKKKKKKKNQQSKERQLDSMIPLVE